MGDAAGKFQTIHPEAGKQGTKIDVAKYEAMKAALLAVVPATGDGVRFMDLGEAVEPHLPAELFANASISWYVVTVKLDLEARGLIERVPGARPQRVRRVT